MSRINHFASAAIVLGLLLTACRSEGEGGGVSSRRATNTPIATTISPEELAKRSAESAGYSMKALAIKDPATPAAGFEVPKESRLVAVQVVEELGVDAVRRGCDLGDDIAPAKGEQPSDH